MISDGNIKLDHSMSVFKLFLWVWWALVDWGDRGGRPQVAFLPAAASDPQTSWVHVKSHDQQDCATREWNSAINQDYFNFITRSKLQTAYSKKLEHVLNLSVLHWVYLRPSLGIEFVLQQLWEFHSNFPGLSSHSLPPTFTTLPACPSVCNCVCVCRRLETCCLNAFTDQWARPCLMMSVRVSVHGWKAPEVCKHTRVDGLV